MALSLGAIAGAIGTGLGAIGSAGLAGAGALGGALGTAGAGIGGALAGIPGATAAFGFGVPGAGALGSLGTTIGGATGINSLLGIGAPGLGQLGSLGGHLAGGLNAVPGLLGKIPGSGQLLQAGKAIANQDLLFGQGGRLLDAAGAVQDFGGTIQDQLIRQGGGVPEIDSIPGPAEFPDVEGLPPGPFEGNPLDPPPDSPAESKEARREALFKGIEEALGGTQEIATGLQEAFGEQAAGGQRPLPQQQVQTRRTDGLFNSLIGNLGGTGLAGLTGGVGGGRQGRVRLGQQAQLADLLRGLQ
jgi:hypothetical protein